MYAVREGLRKFNIPHNFEIESIIYLYARWIREGKLPVNSDWNKDIKAKFTLQDPCQLVRKTFGDDVAQEMRFVVKSVVGEENFIEMQPNMSNNFCCGGGGGFLQATGYGEQRRQYGKIKYDQIVSTGADYCITPCHNCHSQIHDLSEYYGAHFPVVHLWTLIACPADFPEKTSGNIWAKTYVNAGSKAELKSRPKGRLFQFNTKQVANQHTNRRLL